MEKDIEKMQDFIMLLRTEPEDNPKAFLEIDYASQKELAQTIENLINKCKEQGEQINLTERVQQNYKNAFYEKAIENTKLREKCEEQEKMIKLMGRTMHCLCLICSQGKKIIRKYCKIYNSGNTRECEGLICSECVANYFRKKAKGE